MLRPRAFGLDAQHPSHQCVGSDRTRALQRTYVRNGQRNLHRERNQTARHRPAVAAPRACAGRRRRWRRRQASMRDSSSRRGWRRAAGAAAAGGRGLTWQQMAADGVQRPSAGQQIGGPAGTLGRARAGIEGFQSTAAATRARSASLSPAHLPCSMFLPLHTPNTPVAGRGASVMPFHAKRSTNGRPVRIQGAWLRRSASASVLLRLL